MPFGVGDLVEGARREVAETFREGAGFLADQYGEALRALPDGPPVVALARGVARQACRRYADNPTGFPGPVAAGFERVCRPYLDDIGYGAPPVVDLPFRGGQCAGRTYQISCTTTVFPSSTCVPVTNPFNTTALGPIRGPFFDSVSPPPGGPLCSGTTGTRAFLRVGPNQDILVLAGGSFGARVSGISVTPIGGPDNCGNQPPEFRPPAPPPAPGPRVEPFSPTPEIDVDIDLTINNDGDITFNIGTGPVVIDPFPEVPPPGQTTDPPGSGYPPGEVGDPAAPDDTGPGGVSAGCAPAGKVLVGVKVNILEPLPQVSEYDPLVRRGVCYVYMGVPGNLALEPSGVALRDGQFCLAPVDYLTCYEVRANTGYNLRVTPYYRNVESQEI